MKKQPIILIIISLSMLFGQSVDSLIIDNKVKIERANNYWDVKSMEETRNNFERLLNMRQQDGLINYYIAYCDYRLVNYYNNEENTEKATLYVNDGIENLESCIKINRKFSDGYALLSILYSRKIELSSSFWSGFIYGSKSSRAIDKSIKINDKNPRAFLIKGINTFYTPSKWGGSKEEAIALVTKATNLYTGEAIEPILPDWGHSEAYAWKGLFEADLGLTNDALISYEKA